MNAELHAWQLPAAAWTLQMRLWGRPVGLPEGERTDFTRAMHASIRQSALKQIRPRDDYGIHMGQLYLAWEEQVVEGYRCGAFVLDDAGVDEDAVRLIREGNWIARWREALTTATGVRSVEDIPTLPEPQQRPDGKLYLRQTDTGWLVTGSIAAYYYRLKQIGHQFGGVYGRLTRSWWFQDVPEELQELVAMTQEEEHNAS